MDGEVVHGNQLFNNCVMIVDFSLHNYPSCDTCLSGSLSALLPTISQCGNS